MGEACTGRAPWCHTVEKTASANASPPIYHRIPSRSQSRARRVSSSLDRPLSLSPCSALCCITTSSRARACLHLPALGTRPQHTRAFPPRLTTTRSESPPDTPTRPSHALSTCCPPASPPPTPLASSPGLVWSSCTPCPLLAEVHLRHRAAKTAHQQQRRHRPLCPPSTHSARPRPSPAPAPPHSSAPPPALSLSSPSPTRSPCASRLPKHDGTSQPGDDTNNPHHHHHHPDNNTRIRRRHSRTTHPRRTHIVLPRCSYHGLWIFA